MAHGGTAEESVSNDPFTTFATSMPRFENPACVASGFPADVWFPEPNRNPTAKEEQIELASSICRFCVHRSECLQYALDEGISDGVWGGVLVQEVVQLSNSDRANHHRQRQLDDVRRRLELGWTMQRACLDVGIHVNTYKRYLIYERNGWPAVSRKKKGKGKQ